MDFPLETTFDYKFTTRSSAGLPTQLAGSPAVEIYEDNSTTQITAAETLTVDFDTVTGLNNLRIAATAANGFEVGKSYSAVISAGTVDGTSVVGEVICNFTIERASADMRSINGNATAADKLALSADTIVSGTVDTVTNTHTPTTTEFQADDITEATGSHFNGRVVIFTSGVLLNQATDITGYSAVGGIGQFTVTAMTEAPANDDTFIII